jgi:hypothetical protein
MELARVSRAVTSAACAAGGSGPVWEAFAEEERTVRFAMAFTFLVSISSVRQFTVASDSCSSP